MEIRRKYYNDLYFIFCMSRYGSHFTFEGGEASTTLFYRFVVAHAQGPMNALVIVISKQHCQCRKRQHGKQPSGTSLYDLVPMERRHDHCRNQCNGSIGAVHRQRNVKQCQQLANEWQQSSETQGATSSLTGWNLEPELTVKDMWQP